MSRPLGPVASYRVQLTPAHAFDGARRQLARLHALGISHLYLSPVTEAVPGSTHGYDVVDHSRVRDELGGLDGLTALLDALAERRMLAVIDHVANHVCVERPELNPQWWALLRDGPDGAAGRWFDVDWAAGGGRVLLPVLDRLLQDLVSAGAVSVEAVDGAPLLRVGELRFPLAPGTEHLTAVEAIDRQHYLPVHWRRLERNVRRFFTIDGLVAVRVEHPEVAAAVDTVPRLLVEHEAFGGVRVDHIDGLADPAAYLHGLRDLIGDRWLLVEKILAPGEHLPGSWPVDGTTGYEHARLLEHAMLEPTGFAAIARGWQAASGDVRPFRDWELQARREVLDGGLRPDRDRVAAVAARALPAIDGADLRDAVTALSTHLGRYRTYLPAEGGDALEAARLAAAAERADLATTIDAVAHAIAEPGDDAAVELRTRWQQLTGPAAAKGVEDRVFWRYSPLASLGEVGGHPDVGVDPIGDLHAEQAATQRDWPTTMLAGTTHDVARSEDVRAAGLALAASPGPWSRVVDEWMTIATFPDVDVGAQWLALQTVATTPDLSADRLTAFLVKAAREAGLQTSWTDPEEHYEGRLRGVALDMLAWPPIVELSASLDVPGRAISVAMLAVRATAPGAPDVYQGTEAFRPLLVDPDNRVPPDEAELDELVDSARQLDGPAAWAQPGAAPARAVVLRRLLALRRQLPAVFGPDGGYLPLVADGAIAFARLDADGSPRVVTLVARPGSAPTAVTLPPGRWRSVLEDVAGVIERRLELGSALERFPAVVLVRHS